MADRVVAVVVTYNRRDLLRECLGALRAQDHRLAGVIVVDNASTDGTPSMLRDEFPWVTLLALPDNQGGAGGFHAGVAAARDTDADWIWLLDDDTIASPQSLARLLEAEVTRHGLPAPAVLSSRVVWRDGRPHPMNMPIIRRRDVTQLVAGTEAGLLPLRAATFVSLLVRRDVVERHGLPPAHFFIWADDIDYTARILREEHGYLVPDSIVEHRTTRPHSSIDHAGDRFYFHVRNNLFMLRGSAWTLGEKISLLGVLALSVVSYLRTNGFRAHSVAVTVRGLRDGLLQASPPPQTTS